MDTLQLLHADIARKNAERERLAAEVMELEKAAEVLKRYEKSAITGATQPASTPQIKPEPVVRENTKAARVMQAVVQHVGTEGSAHTDELLKLPAVASEGMDNQRLSTTLSRYKDQYGIKSDRRNGWSLKSEAPPDGNPGGASGATLSEQGID